jgi:hypothetical protein
MQDHIVAQLIQRPQPGKLVGAFGVLEMVTYGKSKLEVLAASESAHEKGGHERRSLQGRERNPAGE